MKSRADREREQYARRKELGQCVRCGDPTVAESLWCAKHLSGALDAAKAAARDRRRRRRARGECGECGLPKDQKRRGRPVQKTVIPSFPDLRSDPVSLLRRGTVTEPITEGDGRTRSRFRGSGLRGGANQTASVVDGQELLLARKALDAAMVGLHEWRRPEVQQLPRIQKAAARRSYLALAHLALRHLEELLERAGYDRGGDE